MANNSYAGQLIDEIDKLKKQIERMKCCFNCKYHDTGNCKLSPDDWTYCDASIEKEAEKYCLTKDVVEFDLSKVQDKTLYHILFNIKCFDDFCFDVFSKKQDFCFCGSRIDVATRFVSPLTHLKWSDVYKAFCFLSDITQTYYIRIILNYNRIDEVRKKLNIKSI